MSCYIQDVVRRSRAEAAETRDRIIDSAAKIIRAHGLAHTSVAQVMSEAGLTHGGFYKHFESKEALCAAAIERAGEEATSALANRLMGARRLGIDPFVDAYLSKEHRAATRTGQGCVVAALAGEVLHADPASRRALTQALEQLVEVVEEPLKDSPSAHEEAMAAVAAAVGAIILSRAVDDPGLSDALLASTAALLKARDR